MQNIKAMVKITDYVNDYADVLNERDKSLIRTDSRFFESVEGAQIVVVTVQSLDGETLEDYAFNLFRETGLGDKDKKNGILILAVIDEKKVRIQVGPIHSSLFLLHFSNIAFPHLISSLFTAPRMIANAA